MVYVPRAIRSVNEALEQHPEVKRVFVDERTPEQIQKQQKADAEQLLIDIKEFSLQGPQKAERSTYISDRAKLSRSLEQQKPIKYVPLNQQKQKQQIQLLHAKYNEFMTQLRHSQLHIMKQLFSDFHSKTVATGYACTQEYSNCLTDSIMEFIAYLMESQKLSILCQVLDESRGYYYQQYPQIYHSVLSKTLHLLIDYIPTLPQGYQCKIEQSIFTLSISQTSSRPSDNLFSFIMRMMHFLQTSATTCFYPDVLVDVVSNFMLFCVGFQRSQELAQVIQEASEFSWQPIRYDDYSSVFVQKLVYKLRRDMFCALISLRMYDQCYALFDLTTKMVDEDLENQLVELDDIHEEILDFLKLTIKFYYLKQQHLFQAQALYSYVRLASAFQETKDLQSYANEALILVSVLPYVNNAAYTPGFMLQANEEFCLNEHVLKLTYDALAERLCPFVDLYNVSSLRQGSRNSIFAALRSLSQPPQRVLDFIATFLAFPQYERDPFAFLSAAKNELDAIALEKYHRDVVTYADLVTMKMIENGVILYMAQQIRARASFSVTDVEGFCAKVFSTMYQEDLQMLRCFQSKRQTIFSVVQLLSLSHFSGVKLDLTTMGFVYQQRQILMSEQQYNQQRDQLNDSLAKNVPPQSKFRRASFFNRFYQLRPVTAAKKIDHAQQALKIIVRRDEIAVQQEKRKKTQEEEEMRFEKQKREIEDKLASQALERQKDQQLRSIIGQIIQQYIIDQTAETDDQEMAEYLRSIDLNAIPILKQQREICRKQQEFQRQRLQKRQADLGQIAQKVEAQLWYMRQLSKNQHQVEFEQKVSNLNAMLEEMAPIRYEEEKKAFENIQVIQKQLEATGDYKQLLADAEANAHERLLQRQHDYDEKFRRTAEEIKQRHLDELGHIAELKKQEDLEKEAEKQVREARKQQELHRAQQNSKQSSAPTDAPVIRGAQAPPAYQPSGKYIPPHLRGAAQPRPTPPPQPRTQPPPQVQRQPQPQQPEKAAEPSKPAGNVYVPRQLRNKQ